MEREQREELGPLRARLYRGYVSHHAYRWTATNEKESLKRLRTLRARLSRLPPPDKSGRCLDVGCGSGEFMRLLGELGYESVQGVDLSPEQVELARTVGAVVHHGEARSFLKHNRGWDLITALSLIEHMTREEAADLLDKAFDALHPGGRIIVLTPNAQSPFACQMRYGDLTHEWIYTPHALISLLSHCGFIECRAYSIAPVVHGPLSLLRRIAWGAISLALTGYWLVEGGTTGGRIFSREMIVTGQKHG